MVAFDARTEMVMTGFPTLLALSASVALAILGGRAITAADKYTVRVSDGLALSEFRGYEDWAVVDVAQTEDELKVIVADPTMIAAYKAGIPLNDQEFPEGSAIAKIHWKPQKSTEAPFDVRIGGDARQSVVHHQGQQTVREQRWLGLRPLCLRRPRPTPSCR